MFKKDCGETQGSLPENCVSTFKELKREYKLYRILSYMYSYNSLHENHLLLRTFVIHKSLMEC